MAKKIRCTQSFTTKTEGEMVINLQRVRTDEDQHP